MSRRLTAQPTPLGVPGFPPVTRVLTLSHLSVLSSWRSDHAAIPPPYRRRWGTMYRKWTSGVAVMALAACSAQQPGQSPSPTTASASVPAQQTCIIGEGTASWYHARNKRGAVPGELVAAHRSLPV